uniref:Peritrophin-44-like n=1 Tax=Hirondellea gigas TaxID=1518452 RepID=A0A2P2HW84_9CRUS
METWRCAVSLLFLLVATTYGQLRFNPQRAAAQQEALVAAPQVFFDGEVPPLCPEPDGVWEDGDFCDAYWECVNDVPKEIFCPDGLVFDINKGSGGYADPCDTPHVVHCGSRQKLQEATFPNEFCPRLYGSYEHPDSTVCNVFFMCVNAVHTEVTCADGLYFNRTQGNCNWPHISLRTGCIDKPKVSKDGVFSCPGGEYFTGDGHKNPHPSFPNEADCSKFYVCLNGNHPQAASCNAGLVFDAATMLCGLPETVPECEGWYANDPQFAHYYDDVPATGRSDPGRVDTVG